MRPDPTGFSHGANPTSAESGGRSGAGERRLAWQPQCAQISA
jgi:hypothetical protein